MNQHGRAYEHELVNALDELLEDVAWVTSSGYSGNAKTDDCDLVVVVDPMLCTSVSDSMYCIEAKKRKADSGKRFTAFSGSADGEDGLDELNRLIDATPSWAAPIVVLKVSRRKVFVLNATRLRRILEGEELPEGQYAVLQPRLTPSENVSMVKPETDEWPAARSAQSDERTVAEELGLIYDE